MDQNNRITVLLMKNQQEKTKAGERAVLPYKACTEMRNYTSVAVLSNSQV